MLGGRQPARAGGGVEAMSTSPLQIKVIDKGTLVFEQEFEGAVLLGRQSEGEEVYKSRRIDNNKWKLVVARFDEKNVSRDHAVLEPVPGSKVKVTNLSTKLPVHLPGTPELSKWDPKEQPAPPTRVLDLPFYLNIGPKMVKVQELEEDGGILQSLSEVTRPPGRSLGGGASKNILLEPASRNVAAVGGSDPEQLVRMLQEAIGVLQDAANADDFFNKAADAMVSNVGLDNGWVLTWDAERNEWIENAYKNRNNARPDPERKPSRRFLTKVKTSKKTSWQAPDQSATESNRSLMPVQAAVAAPILDRQGEVIGALYGDRRQSAASINGGDHFTKLDALFVELLAGGVAAGLARLKQDAEAERARGQFDLFFGQELATELRENPSLMDGREATITILFADIRGFSRISERLGHKDTFDWINFTMEKLSDCVLKHDGLLVDYIGDELMAMWGAPKDNDDQALLACRAALAMQEAVPEINAVWQPRTGVPMGVGIGINTGKATTGNTGSKYKFKYGPLGNTVNLASRVQGATKYLKASILVTESTFERLPATFNARRLCSVRVVNIQEPVCLYELAEPARIRGDWNDLRSRYEQALKEFEDRNFHHAAALLGNILTDYPGDGPDHPGDGPSLVLLKRAVDGLIEKELPGHPVLELGGK